jgi:hypothetical protein
MSVAMKLLLFFLLVVTGGAAFYEFTTEHRISQGCQHQLTAWQARIDALQDENKKLTDEKTEITHSIAEAQAETRTLSVALQRAQLEAANRGQENAPPPVANSGPNATPSVNLGTITTLLGQTFQQCKLLKVEADGITFSHTEGITKVLFAYLRPEMQRRFGYDPQKAAAATEASLQYQEQLREAAAQRAENAAGTPPPAP